MRGVPSRLFPILLLALASILFFSRLSGTDLKEPNEPISAEAAREMMQRGDWIVPTVNGEPYPDKPPLLFWGIWAASLPFGEVNEISARLPSALSALALVLAVYFLTRSALGPRAAFLGAATLAMSTFFVEQARYVQHDMLLCLGVSVAILALFHLKDGEAPAGGWMILASCALAFGVLDKGPIALALPTMVLAAEGALAKTFFRRLGPLVAAGLLGLVLPFSYYALLARGHGLELLELFLFRHNVDRFVAGFDHTHPWWFFLARSPVDLLPGTLLLPAAAVLRRVDPLRRQFHRRLWIWILVPLVFFSLSASKRPVYMLPALPPIALLCGTLLDVLAEEKRESLARRLTVTGEGLALAFLGIAGLASPFIASRRAPHLLTPSLLLGALAVAGAAAGLHHLYRGKLLAAHGWLLAGLAGVWLVAILWVLPWANPINSPRPFAEAIARQVPPGAPLKTFGLYRFRSGYIFYARRLMPRLPDRGALDAYLKSDERVFCVLPRKDYLELRGRLAPPPNVVAEGSAGHREEVLISNLPPVTRDPLPPGSPGTAPASPPPAAHSESAP